MTTLILNRRNLLKLISLLPFLRKLIEPAPEVVQAMQDQPRVVGTEMWRSDNAMQARLNKVRNEVRIFCPELYRRKSQ